MTVVIEPIPCLRDNYAYLVHAPGADEAWLVDPSEVDPPARALAERGLRLAGILATHHHVDHVGGIAGLVAAQANAPVVAGHLHDKGRIPAQTILVDAPPGEFVPTPLVVAGRPVLAAHIPGHTLGAIAWYLPGEGDAPGDVFTGDTLFAGGCGRLFEGTPAQMHRSLQTICALPGATRLWFGHEYTAANLRFAASVEPDNRDVAERAARLAERTTPTTVALERATNPFVRAQDAEELAARRAAKDSFK
jgi:hydroxyacylglutathione hydrolase